MAHQVALSNFQDIDGVLWGGWRWDSPNLTYAFPTNTAAYGGYVAISGFVPFNASQQVSAVRALLEYGAVCGLNISKATTAGSANLRFAEADSINLGNGIIVNTGGSAFAQIPDDSSPQTPPFSQGDTWYNHTGYRSAPIGSFAAVAGIMHELGHALGLKHGHMASGGNNTLLPDNHNSQEYSIMTYKAFPGQQPTPGSNGQFALPKHYPTTPMMDDIFALQWLYGADYNYNKTNTVYTWNTVTGEMLVNGHHYNAVDNVFGGVPVHHKIFMTVWDGGGIDTYNFANFTTAAVINLLPGFWSTPSNAMRADLGSGHFARGSIANALSFANDYRAYIENANGGSNNDSITGNTLANVLHGNGGNDVIAAGAGNDQLFGDAGNDVLTAGAGKDYQVGGAGLDRFVFNSLAETTVAATGRDLIGGFAHGDKIDLHLIDANALLAGNQAFVFRLNFTGHAGEGQYDKLNATTSLVTLDVNGDSVADAAFLVTGVTQLFAGDFIL